ncbi:hypothetical protein M0R45_000523 [Rubus argutus]|uniref:Uncharacterized protein n=1 Tax=Rubus argutus TaxID=59490 RepID=A0AAW1VKJ0_RUBAR
MDPCPFVRILVGDLTLKFPSVSKPSFSTFSSAVPLIVNDGAQNQDARSHSLNACFNLSKTQIEKLDGEATEPDDFDLHWPEGRHVRAQLSEALGPVTVPLAELGTAESRPVVYHNGWIGIGGSKKNGSAQTQFFLSPVFTCKFGFRSASDMQSRSMSEPSTPRNWAVPFIGSNQKEQSAKERKGLVVDDPRPFRLAGGGGFDDRRTGHGSRGAALRCGSSVGGCDAVGYKFELLSTTLANSTVSASNGGKFTIDLTSSLTPGEQSTQQLRFRFLFGII